MADSNVVKQYFDALLTQNGTLAASLFTENGVIDNYRGRRLQGRSSIEIFINNVVPREIEYISALIHEPPRSTVFARMTYPDGRVELVRWVFHSAGELIDHVGNTRVEEPSEFLLLPQPSTTLVDSVSHGE